MTQHEHAGDVEPKKYWEDRYGDSHIWSGKVNAVLARVVEGVEPGTALDLGCGEGGDVIWLAEHGWRALGVDISTKALQRGRAAAAERGLSPKQAAFLEQDLTHLNLPERFDLVAASFLHSPVALERTAILRRAMACVRVGGLLLVTAHATPPPWASEEHRAKFQDNSPQQEISDLTLAQGEWETLLAELSPRTAIGPDGQEGALDDSVVLLRRVADHPAR